MIDAVLCMTVLAAVLFGWFLMKRLDRFLDENQKRIFQEETQHPEPPCVVLEGTTPSETLEEQRRVFCESHARVKILIYDPERFCPLQAEVEKR